MADYKSLAWKLLERKSPKGSGEIASSSSSEASSATGSSEKRKYHQVNTSVESSDAPDSTCEEETKKQKVNFVFNKPSAVASSQQRNATTKSKSISIKLGAQQAQKKQSPAVSTSNAIANIFNDDDDDEEEMPPEAKMRMRNFGRETPTSTGPNSFGKTKFGFCDTRKGLDKEEKEEKEKKKKRAPFTPTLE